MRQTFEHAISVVNSDLSVPLVGETQQVDYGNSVQAFSQLCQLMQVIIAIKYSAPFLSIIYAINRSNPERSGSSFWTSCQAYSGTSAQRLRLQGHTLCVSPSIVESTDRWFQSTSASRGYCSGPARHYRTIRVVSLHFPI